MPLTFYPSARSGEREKEGEKRTHKCKIVACQTRRGFENKPGDLDFLQTCAVTVDTSRFGKSLNTFSFCLVVEVRLNRTLTVLEFKKGNAPRSERTATYPHESTEPFTVNLTLIPSSVSHKQKCNLKVVRLSRNSPSFLRVATSDWRRLIYGSLYKLITNKPTHLSEDDYLGDAIIHYRMLRPATLHIP